MRSYLTTFGVWALAQALYGAYALRLIPAENLLICEIAPKDREYFIAIALWWATPLVWFISPAVPQVGQRVAGLALFAAGAWLVIWARRVNPFFLPTVRKPGWVVTVGPYKRLRHPGYYGFAAMSLGSILMLGHRLGFLPFGFYVGLLVWRARRENRLLQS